MGSEDDEEPDLMLVSTYVPVLLTLLKATCLVVFSEMLEYLEVHNGVKLIAHCAVLYIVALQCHVVGGGHGVGDPRVHMDLAQLLRHERLRALLLHHHRKCAILVRTRAGSLLALPCR